MKTKIRILHIDDNLHDRQIVKETLQNAQDEIEIIEIDNRLEFELHLSKSDFDLILSEINISGIEGLNVLQIVKEKKPEIPVIIVTGKGSEEIVVEAMKLGAADYVVKSEKHIQNLTPTIRKVIENRKIQDEHNAAQLALRKSEERFRLLFDNSIDGVLLTKPDGSILEANTAACTIFGRTEEELKQVGRNGIIDATDPRLAKVIEDRSRTGKYKGELTGLRKDGTPFPIEISSVLFLDSEGSQRTSMTIRDITERKLTKKLIQENNSRLEIAMQAANMAWWEMDMSTGNVIFEKRKAKMLGYSPEKFKHYKDFMALVHPDDYDKAMNAMHGHIDGLLDRYEIEYRILTKSGEYKWFYDVGSITKTNSKGTPLSIAGIVIDISDRKQSEELLVASEIRYRRLFESAKDGILILDAETGMIADVNPFLVKLLGYSAEQFQGKKIWEIGVFSDLIANQSKFLELQQSEYVRYDDLPLKTSDGREIAVEFESNVYLVNSHKVIQCNIRDITERKSGEEKEKELEVKYTKLYGSIRDAILVADNDRKIIDCNPAFTEMFGYDLNDIKNKNTVTIYENIKQFNELGQALKNHTTEKSPFLYTINYKKKNGEVFPGETSVYYLKDLNGDITGFIGLIRDITERKHLEQEKEVLTYKLNERIKELTCLYAISSIFEAADISLDVMLNQAVKMIPSGWQYPNICGAKIIIDDNEYQTTDYRQTKWKMSADIKIIGKKSGTVEISYLEAKEEIDEGPFLKEERGLLNLIAERIGYIVERKKAEEQQIIQTTALEATAFSVIITNVEGTIIWVNNSFTKMTGYSKEEAIGKTPSILNSGKHDKTFFKNMWDTIKAGHVWHGEVFNKRKDGSLLTDEMTITPVLDKDGNVRNFITLKQDITERKNTENALKESEKKFRSLLENSADAIFITNPMGKYIYTNRAATNLLGFTPEEMLSKSIADLTPKDKIENLVDFSNEIMNKGKVFAEIELLKKDGNFISTDLNAVLLPDGFVYASCRDITESKKAKKEIQNLNENLELKVKERTKKLTEVNTHLIEANAMAEQASKAKSEFLSNMSHEIRPPMNAVLGYSELLSNVLEDKTQKDYLKSIISSGKTLLTLINDILDLSKIEAGKLELTFDYVNTHSFFSEFERVFFWKVAEKGLTFILDIVSGVPAGIYIDETRLRQIILNLLGNAVKFTHKGHIKLKAYIENPQIVQLSNKKSEEYIDLIIEIEDSGIGISREFQNQIFEPFTQELHKNQFEGTGLGLAITRRLLALMKGTIRLKSELNKGSTFQIKIPNIAYLRDFERKDDTIHIDPASIEFDTATLLIADDIAHNRKYFVDALKNTKIKVVEAEDGLAAYNLVKSIVPDIIITDLRMPKLDGIGLLKKIQRNAKLSHIPVIAYSASAMKEQKEHIFNCKFAGLLLKPVHVTDLYIELMNYLPYTSTQITEKDKSALEQTLLAEINDIQSLIHSLETVYTDVWKKFEVTQPLEAVKEFGKNLENLGNDHNAEIIEKYGNELMLSAKNFNIESILKLLNNYQAIVKKIKDYQSKNY